MARLGVDNDTFVFDNDGTITDAGHEGAEFGKHLVPATTEAWKIRDTAGFQQTVDQAAKVVASDLLSHSMVLENRSLPNTWGDRIPAADGLIYNQLVVRQALSMWFEGNRDLSLDGKLFFEEYMAAYGQTPVQVRPDAVSAMYRLQSDFGITPVIVTNSAEASVRARWTKWGQNTDVLDQFKVVGGAQKYVMGNLPAGAPYNRLMEISPVDMSRTWQVHLNRPKLYEALLEAGKGKIPAWYVGDIAQWDLVSQEMIVRALGGQSHTYLLSGPYTLAHERAFMDAEPSRRAVVPTFDAMMEHITSLRK